MHYRVVVVDENGFDGEGWDFSYHDSAEGVGDTGVDTNEGEGGIEGFVFVELDFKALFDLLRRAIKWGNGGRGGSTWENFSRLHSWSSPG